MTRLGCLLAAGAAVAVLSACGSTGASPDGVGTDAQRTSATSATPVRAQPKLSILDAPRGPSAQLADVRRLAPKSLVDKFHLDFSSARFATVSRAQPLFVARGADAYCLLDWAQSLTNCWTGDAMRDGEASVTSLCSPQIEPGTIEVGGVVPDGVRKVTILRGGRFTDETVDVRNNVFVAVLPAGNPLPLRLRWNGRGASHSTGIPEGTTYRACGATS